MNQFNCDFGFVDNPDQHGQMSKKRKLVYPWVYSHLYEHNELWKVVEKDSQAIVGRLHQKPTAPVSALQARLFNLCHATVRCLEDRSVEKEVPF